MPQRTFSLSRQRNDYPYIDKDGVEFYKGKSLEEIAKLFKVDLNAQ